MKHEPYSHQSFDFHYTATRDFSVKYLNECPSTIKPAFAGLSSYMASPISASKRLLNCFPESRIRLRRGEDRLAHRDWNPGSLW
jgi:hypothetical protein